MKDSFNNLMDDLDRLQEDIFLKTGKCPKVSDVYHIFLELRQ